MHELIITEKPSAAQKIAQALSDGKVVVQRVGQVSIYKIKHNGKEIHIVSAVGHLFTVAEKKKSFKYPSFDIDWKASYEVNKSSDYIKKYADVIGSESKNSDSFVVACDYDVEGEVIGLNALRFICKQKDGFRMKFSTLTKPDLIEAYENKAKSLEWGLAKAGEARHFLDWLYGINLSRALTIAVKKGKLYKTMSAGRVQGPALKILADREKEIKAFVSQKFWQIQLLGKVHNRKIEAWHKEDKFWEQQKAKHILSKCKDKTGKISNVEASKIKQPPPFPFDLTTLQTESYRNFGYTPAKTQELAQELYTGGHISYPRTSSQQLSPKIGVKKIITDLTKQSKYKELGNFLLAKNSLNPNNGPKTDPAHPAIYPTGSIPTKATTYALKVYDLIVKRFFATFGDAAERETVKATILVNGEPFIAKGITTTFKGWHTLYEPYVKLKDEELPKVAIGDIVNIQKIESLEKETQPPKRYTQAFIIKELEKRGLGTKSTRAQILERLIDREYIVGKSLEVTKIGLKTVETLEKYCPDIISEELTRHFEEEMEAIKTKREGEKKVLEDAKKKLTKILADIKKHEEKIGNDLAESFIETEKENNYIGKCPKCAGNLVIKYSPKNKSRFIACDNYPDCTLTMSIPNGGKISATDKICEKCKFPIITIISKRPQEVCINHECPTKNTNANPDGGKCPSCGAELVLRKSVYGAFYGCSNYPKCRYIKPSQNKPLKQ